MSNNQDFSYKDAFSEEFEPSPLEAAKALNSEYKDELTKAAIKEEYANQQVNQSHQQQSNVVDAIGYSDHKKTLRVEYKNGQKLDYQNIGSQIIDKLKEAKNIGRFVAEKIHSVFETQPVTSNDQTIETLPLDSQTKQAELVDIALNLTQPTRQFTLPDETSISQIGEYEIWRDDRNLAVINTSQNKLVAYSNLQDDLLPTVTSSENLTSVRDRLWSEINQKHPHLDSNYDETTIDRGWEKFQAKDPLAQRPENKVNVPESTNDLIRTQLEKLPKRYDQIKQWLGNIDTSQYKQLAQLAQSQSVNWIKDRADDVKIFIQQNKLTAELNLTFQSEDIRQSLSNLAQKPLKLGSYQITHHPTENKTYLVDRQKEPIAQLNFDDRQENIQITHLSRDSSKLTQALDSLIEYNQNNNPILVQQKLTTAVAKRLKENQHLSQENDFNLGNYQVVQRKNTVTLKQNGSVILTFDKSRNPINPLTVHPKSWQGKTMSTSLKKMQNVINEFNDPHLKPQGFKQKLRQQITQKSHEIFLANSNGQKKDTIGVGSYLITRDCDRFHLKTRTGDTVLSYQVGDKVKILKASDRVNQLGELFSQLDRKSPQIQTKQELQQQQQRVNTVAPILAKYLNLKGEKRINTPLASVAYNQRTQTISYQSHQNPQETLKAKWNGKKWLDIGSTLSQEKTQEFQTRLQPNLERNQTLQNQQKQSTAPSFSR